MKWTNTVLLFATPMLLSIFYDAVINYLNENVCETAGCAKASEMIREWLNESVDPCDNFYEFACGNFPPKNKTESPFVRNRVEVIKQMLLLLMKQSTQDEWSPLKTMRKFYQTCAYYPQIHGPLSIENMLYKYGGWPAAQFWWDSENWNWPEENVKIANDGLEDGLLFRFNISSDLNNSSKRMLYIDQSSFGLNPKILVNGIEDSDVKKYYENMTALADKFIIKSFIEGEHLETLKFEIELAKIITPRSRNISDWNNRFTIKQLQATYPFVNWLDYINGWLNDILKVDEKEVVIVADPNYLEKLGPLLKNTSNRTIANYFAWRNALFLTELFFVNGSNRLTSHFHCLEWTE